MSFKSAFTLILRETVNGKHKEVGKATIPCPTLADFGLSAAQAKDDAGNPATDNGLPVYEDPKAQWLQDAIQLAVSVKVRNRFQKGQLKAGQTLPEDFDSLTAESARTGEALVLRREARADFENFLRSLQKAEPIVARLGEMFWLSNKVLSTASEKYLEAITHYAERWVAQLDDAKKSRFAPKITELQESINAATSEDDLMTEGAGEKAA
jgi:hypothetical protein